jgi:hypothetical protein
MTIVRSALRLPGHLQECRDVRAWKVKPAPRLTVRRYFGLGIGKPGQYQVNRNPVTPLTQRLSCFSSSLSYSGASPTGLDTQALCCRYSTGIPPLNSSSSQCACTNPAPYRVYGSTKVTRYRLPLYKTISASSSGVESLAGIPALA